MKKIKVYARCNNQGHILEVGSDGFINDTKNWVKIDEGEGDRYLHAQGNYFDVPVLDDLGVPLYMLENGKAVGRPKTDIESDRSLRKAATENAARDTAATIGAVHLLNKLVVETLAPTLDDIATIVQLKPMLPIWEPGRHLPYKAICVWDDVIYQVDNKNGVDSVAHYPPGREGVHDYISVNLTNKGTKSDPIPAMVGMEYFKDKYYLEAGITYKCTRDYNGSTGHLPKQLVGQYFEGL